MTPSFRTIDDQEYADFISECRARGLNSQDFHLEEHDFLETEITPTTILSNAKVTITRGKAVRTYATGESTDWLVDFAKDLRKGVFD